MEQKKSYTDEKGMTQAERTSARSNTKAVHDGGLSHSSEEASVMGVERRTGVVQLTLPVTTLGDQGRTNGTETKGVPITKQMVWQAYKEVKSHKGSAGADQESIADYEKSLSDNLYKLWNRLTSGSYFPPPVLEVEIPKGDGTTRKLGVPTVNDRIAQQVVKCYLETRLEKEFCEHSYGYRPLKNTHQALSQVRRNVRQYAWVIDMDIGSFFDKMSHELLMKAIDRHVPEKWLKSYLQRWLEAPIEDKEGKQHYRQGQGTPQGGVVSPLLANLFLHYTFDKWFGLKYPELSFVRYADDIIVHCHTEHQSEYVLTTIKKRLAECQLELNEQKTKIVYCKDANRKAKKNKTVKFDFLGFSFQPRTSKSSSNILFLGYDCAISQKSEKKIAEQLRHSQFHRWSNSSIGEIVDVFNPKIRGWINYYGRFRIHKLGRIFSYFHNRLTIWALNRYKRFHKSKRKASRWIRELAKHYPTLFVHWQYGFQSA